MKLNFKLFFVCVLVVIIVLVCFFMISHMKNKTASGRLALDLP